MTSVTAQLKYFRTGPRKMRLVANFIRGKSAKRAVAMLSVLNKKAARPLLKLLQSAMANAKNNHALSPDNLFIKTITVNPGPMLKRWMPKAHGRATPVRERTCHVKLVLMPFPEKKTKDKTKDATKK